LSGRGMSADRQFGEDLRDQEDYY